MAMKHTMTHLSENNTFDDDYGKESYMDTRAYKLAEHVSEAKLLLPNKPPWSATPQRN